MPRATAPPQQCLKTQSVVVPGGAVQDGLATAKAAVAIQFRMKEQAAVRVAVRDIEGREIRVLVSSEDVSDDYSHVLAKDIARKIEEEMTYPGQIRVNVIRETRAVEYANK